MKNIIFYKDNFINREIAFVLNIEYKFIDNIKNLKNEIIYIDNIYEKEFIKNNLKRYQNYILFEDICNYLDNFNHIQIQNQRKLCKNINEVNKIQLENLSLSEMLIKVLYSKPKDINCPCILNEANLHPDGNLWPCCPNWVAKPFGNILIDDDIYNNYLARIIKLSALNKTYCFCNLNFCKYNGSQYLDKFNENIDLKVRDIPKQLSISIDRRCNLRCNSCRKSFFVPTNTQKEMSNIIAKKLLNLNWLNNTCVFIAGDGEVFFSPVYLDLLKSKNMCGDTIKILSNGTLFTKDKWQLLENKYKNIYIAISIDAATKETYEKLRHGNFDILLKNLNMLKELKKNNKIVSLQFNFVVQKDNYKEMENFVKLAKHFNVDIVQFTKLSDWGVLNDYNEKSLIINDYLVYDLYKEFQKPIFKDKIVNIDYFKYHIECSKKHYDVNK